MDSNTTGSMQLQQAEFHVPAEQSAQHGHHEQNQHEGMESTFPSELTMCYETLSVKDADERADGHVEQRGECQARNDMAMPVSALEAAVEKENPKVVIGVLGATGAGKSSLINEIINEEGMLATNCMRATMAVATKVACNDGPRRYKAEVFQFIQPNEWKRELEILRHEMLDENPDINAIKTTREKINAVYPELDNGNLADTTMDRLLGHPRIANLLGSSLFIEEDDPRIFADKLKPYIDSKSGTARKDAGLWPLIKTVRLYVKAQAPATGAVLVDLPGLYDSNAARVAVADDYLKRLGRKSWKRVPNECLKSYSTYWKRPRAKSLV
ncbi:nuclear GTPase SLIP-GC [Aspergillus udagawae]|uniref:Nuclear GTPase SLIP-GC n=1 Tax=Aspergillus udagawae TaxID=91492 RepID=A0ABQ1AEL0_9EURO|nr:nuclear GTPase SLIP-GC [Aspergillus udagawae]